jgi:hypothetical protein
MVAWYKRSLRPKPLCDGQIRRLPAPPETPLTRKGVSAGDRSRSEGYRSG